MYNPLLNTVPILKSIANIKEILDPEGFSSNAYTKAASYISKHKPISLNDIPKGSGIGKSISKVIQEYIATARVQFYEDNKHLLTKAKPVYQNHPTRPETGLESIFATVLSSGTPQTVEGFTVFPESASWVCKALQGLSIELKGNLLSHPMHRIVDLSSALANGKYKRRLPV